MNVDMPEIPDNTAVRTALWRALHVEVDAPPPVLDDRIGVQLVAPDAGWRDRPDMDPSFTSGFRRLDRGSGPSQITRTARIG